MNIKQILTTCCFILNMILIYSIGYFCIYLPVLLITKLFNIDKNRMLVGYICRRLNGLCFRLNPFWGLETKYLDKEKFLNTVSQKCIVVCNHLSNLDPYVIQWIQPVEWKYVGKDTLFSIPIFGWMLTTNLDVPIAFASDELSETNTIKESAIVCMKRCNKHLKNGVSMMFFPEARRSDTGELLPFKKGAFYLAIEHQVPIIPMAITGTQKLWPTGEFWMNPGNAKIIVGSPISTSGMTNKDVNTLMENVRNVVATLKEHIEKN